MKLINGVLFGLIVFTIYHLTDVKLQLATLNINACQVTERLQRLEQVMLPTDSDFTTAPVQTKCPLEEFILCDGLHECVCVRILTSPRVVMSEPGQIKAECAPGTSRLMYHTDHGQVDSICIPYSMY